MFSNMFGGSSISNPWRVFTRELGMDTTGAGIASAGAATGVAFAVVFGVAFGVAFCATTGCSSVPAFQGIGQAMAPTLAGTLLSYQLGYGSVMLMCAVASTIALLIYLHVYRALLRVAPEIANKD